MSERERRRPEFDESASTPVTFQGGTFLLPRPYLRIRPVFRGGKRTEEAVLTTGDPEFDRLKKVVIAAAADNDADFVGAVTDLAAYMISKNYDLSDDELGDVFAVPAGADAVPELAWIQEVMAVANGRAPKPGSGGAS